MSASCLSSWHSQLMGVAEQAVFHAAQAELHHCILAACSTMKNSLWSMCWLLHDSGFLTVSPFNKDCLHHDRFGTVFATKPSHKHLELPVCTVLSYCFVCMTVILEDIASAKLISTRALNMLSPANPACCCIVQPAVTCTCVRVIWPELSPAVLPRDLWPRSYKGS